MIGRMKETTELNDLYDSGNSELVAVYGRRRVGKTYLVDETFKDRITFRHAGLSQAEMDDNLFGRPIRLQLQAFYYSLLQQGMKKSHCPGDWLEAFFMLEMHLQELDDGSRQLVFLDELPWMDTPKSGFITAFESFWNSWGCHRSNLMVIVCGSANSWILDKLINNHGGLYGRVTYEIKLEPFSLKENEDFLKYKNVKLSRYDVTQSYMIVGGIPYYLNYFQRGKSLSQNIDELFFSKRAKLRYEFDRLFASVFRNPEEMKRIIKVLNTRSAGFTKKEISEKTGFPYGGHLTEALNALIVSDFIIKYVPFGFSKREEHYKLTDPFCLFYLRFVDSHTELSNDFWQQNVMSGSVSAWRGYAFENVCFQHIEQIKKKLGISGVSTQQSAWSKREDDADGTQIDMIISRQDNIVNMCEIKYCSTEFEVDKDYDRKLRERQVLLSAKIPKKAIVHNTLITTFGLKYNKYSGIIDNVITMDDLYES